MSRYRRIETRVWVDQKFLELSAPRPCGQFLWLHLLSGPQTTNAPGLFSTSIEEIARHLKWPIAATRRCFEEIEAKGMARADWDAGLVWLPKAVVREAPQNKNIVVGWANTILGLPECMLLDEATATIGAFLDSFDPVFAGWFRARLGADASAPKKQTGRRASSEPRSEPRIEPGSEPRSEPRIEPQEQEQEQNPPTPRRVSNAGPPSDPVGLGVISPQPFLVSHAESPGEFDGSEQQRVGIAAGILDRLVDAWVHRNAATGRTVAADDRNSRARLSEFLSEAGGDLALAVDAFGDFFRIGDDHFVTRRGYDLVALRNRAAYVLGLARERREREARAKKQREAQAEQNAAEVARFAEHERRMRDEPEYRAEYEASKARLRTGLRTLPKRADEPPSEDELKRRQAAALQALNGGR